MHQKYFYWIPRVRIHTTKKNPHKNRVFIRRIITIFAYNHGFSSIFAYLLQTEFKIRIFMRIFVLKMFLKTSAKCAKKIWGQNQLKNGRKKIYKKWFYHFASHTMQIFLQICLYTRYKLCKFCKNGRHYRFRAWRIHWNRF